MFGYNMDEWRPLISPDHSLFSSQQTTPMKAEQARRASCIYVLADSVQIALRHCNIRDRRYI
jgi:hypothetical protein